MIEEWPSMNVEPTPESQMEVNASRRENTLLAVERKKCSMASLIDVNAYSS